MWDTMEKNGGVPLSFGCQVPDTQKKAGALFWQIGSQEKMRDTQKVEREFKFVGCHYCFTDATSKTLWGGEHKQNMFCLCSNRICQPPMQKVPLNPSPKTLIPKH